MNDRSIRYRTEGGGADLVRVEVLVPSHGRASVLEHAANLRREHRDEAPLPEPLASYYDEAFSKYRSRCLWNVRPPRTLHGMKVISDCLRSRGGMDAWELATRIRKELSNAP